MNKHKNTISRLLLLLTGIFLSPLSWIINKNKNRIIFNSTTNTKYNFNSKYLFEYYIKNCPNYEIKFVINNIQLREKLQKEIGDYFIDTTSLKGIFYCLKAYTWIVSSLETPVGGIFLRINRLVIHLGHGTPLKNIGFLEKNMSLPKKIYYFLLKNNFSYILSTSENFDEVMQKFLRVPKSRILTSGQPRNDFIFENKKNFLKEKYSISSKSINILYVPTWRQNSETLLFPFSDFSYKGLESFLDENNVNIFMRLHPEFEKKIDFKLKKIKNVYVFDSKITEDITEYLSVFDILITDYSSIFIDFLLLNRPIMYIPYDIEEYNREIGFTVDYNLHTPGPKIKTFNEFKENIKRFIEDKSYFLLERVEENKFYNCCREKNNCEMIKKFIKEKISE